MTNQGLYTPQLEKDACGIGMIANLNNVPTHETVSNALTILENMEHRGASGYEENTGDGAGILIQLPHAFLNYKAKEKGFDLPNIGSYAVAMLFLPTAERDLAFCFQFIQKQANKFGFKIIGRRKVSVDNADLGSAAKLTEPEIWQLFLICQEGKKDKALEAKSYLFRKALSNSIYALDDKFSDTFYVCSCSCRTIVYKGQLTASQLRNYFEDLQDPRISSALALVHSRFSTNTEPKWRLAQPMRCIAHNGEINTIQGNLNWWRAKEPTLHSKIYNSVELQQIIPVCDQSTSDSGSFDNVLEFLVRNGRSLPHALMMMIPEAYQHDAHIEEFKKDFYQYQEAFMEPWDGPASICFSDGVLVGATLDRNGLRPSRYLVTKDNVLILGSEAGCLSVDPANIAYQSLLRPGKILIADLEEQRIIEDDELKSTICQRLPYRELIAKRQITFADLIEEPRKEKIDSPELLPLKRAFGFTVEDEEMILAAMGEKGAEPIGSMGADIPLAVLSRQAQPLANYFKQQFAQVTNPPIDPIRERNYMSLQTTLGASENILSTINEHYTLRLEHPLLQKEQFAKIQNSKHKHFSAVTIDLLFDADGIEGRLENALELICQKTELAIVEGVSIIILSDRNISPKHAPVPSLMAVGRLHHFLIQKGWRKKVSIIIEAGDIIETHQVACLVSFGADALYPYLIDQFFNAPEKFNKYFTAINKGLLKIMSKLGISTLLSYQGSQTFEAIGIAKEVIEKCFVGTISRLGGMTFDMLAREVLVRHQLAYTDNDVLVGLPESGNYQWKRQGEHHLFNPKSIHLLQQATRNNDFSLFKKYSSEINNQAERANTLRSLFEFNNEQTISIDEVEPVENILKRFASGAMSFGSLSHEAHSTLAIAMNRIGGKSNSGEGGEDASRFIKKENGDWERSAIKQVASGRFGVTSNYLVNADQLQIKMAQGAKPGEGGHLPGHKVNDWIAKVRHSIPGVGLISPPPHHDIYSIEDLAQLIFDLKNANRKADISVKLVSKAGVGIIASGVAKAHADHLLIAGHDGGTGASPLSSINHAGIPWELGLSESHQTLVKNRLRDRVTIQADGQMKTGRDLAIATLLGAEEWGIATAALVVEGCILMRKCHLNTCPVGIATQDENLRKNFTGKVEHLVHFFHFLAQELREIMAFLGFRTINEMVGRTDKLTCQAQLKHWKWKSLDLSPILFHDAKRNNQFKSREQNHNLGKVLDRKLIRAAKLVLKNGGFYQSTLAIKNTDRAVGTMLASEITKRYGAIGLAEDSLSFRFIGSAGQSFGAFTTKGLTLTIEGETNDHFGKGLCGAKLIAVPNRHADFEQANNIIIGNVALYGATSGMVFIRGLAGERFAVRNSGATAVVEGVGDHGCEYMTGGEVVILGNTGRNFGAGMSGGLVYIYDEHNNFSQRCNMETVTLENLNNKDEERLRGLIRQHFLKTGSLKALGILQDWKIEKGKFIKVFPNEYKKILSKSSFDQNKQVA